MNRQYTLKLALFFIANILYFTSFAVDPKLTDLPSAYGEQLWISTFDGAWETTNNEPVNMTAGGGWHSFNTATGSVASSAKSSLQLNYSANVRSGVPEGRKSARISARAIKLGSITLATANGNLTTGRINANSATAGDLTKNFNSTMRTDEVYNTPFESRPDSVTVWVNFKSKSSTQLGRTSIFIHGDGVDFQDPPATTASQNAVVAFAGLEFGQTDEKWVRLSIPFNYESYTSFSSFSNVSASTSTMKYNIPGNVEPKYIIATMATNKVPGGAEGDTLWVDDFLMIYKPTLMAENTTGKSTFVSGEEIKVSYTLTGTMSPYNLNANANVVSLQLSDAFGSFDSPTLLDYATTNKSGVFTVALPKGIEIGSGYKLRVITTNYPMISNEINVEIVTDETSVKMPTIKSLIRIYQNPESESFHISNIAENTQLTVVDITGRIVLQQIVNPNEMVAASRLKSGIYFANIEGQTIKIVIKNMMR